MSYCWWVSKVIVILEIRWPAFLIKFANLIESSQAPVTGSAGSIIISLPNDNTTQLNSKLIEKFQKADLILLTGQALSHCVASTVRQLANNFGEDNIKKLALLVDTTSPVPGFEKQGQDFISEMSARGMKVVKTTDIKITKNDLIF